MVEHSFEMSIARSDFDRLLPAAVGNQPFACEEGGYAGADWRIVLETLPDLAIAGVRLERLRVRLQFDAGDAQTIAAFLQRFHLYFRRGGG